MPFISEASGSLIPILAARTSKVADLVLQKAHNGNRIVYLPGIHDAVPRSYSGSEFNSISLREDIHMREGCEGRTCEGNSEIKEPS